MTNNKELMMVRIYKDASRIVFGIALALIVAFPLFAQEETSKNVDAPEKSENLVIPLAFPGEELAPPAEDLDGKTIMAACKEYLGSGDEIKDLRWNSLHKHYRKKANPHFIEEYEGFVANSEGQPPGIRVDFLNYIEVETKKDYFIDYREIYGQDGAFKYREGNIIRVPDALIEAGHHTLKIYLMMLAPFCSLLNTADLEYEGICSWSESEDGAEKAFKCHKIVAVFDDHRIRIREQKVALYIDTKTFDLKRVLYRPGSDRETVKRVKIIDYISRVQTGSVKLPDAIRVVDYWNFEKQATHKYTIEKYALNTGLEGITFGMTDQLPKPRMLIK